jgi:glutaminyl-tRNA synthetase
MIVFSAAMDYLKAKPVDPVKVKEFENACGVGVKVTPDQIEECVSISCQDF